MVPLFAKILGISGGIIYFLTVMWILIVFVPNGIHYAEDSIWLLSLIIFPFTGFAAILGGFLVEKRVVLATWLLFISGLIGLIFLLGTPAAIPLLLAGFMILGNKPSLDQTELTQLQKLVAAGNFSKAMPRIFKLSRANPDNPEIRMLIKQWREYKKNLSTGLDSSTKE